MEPFADILGGLAVAGSALYLLLLLYFRGGINQIGTGSGTRRPSVSVIVPAHNEADCIGDTLEALRAQIYPKNRLEIILVNDRSTDETPAIMETFASRRRNIKVIHVNASERSNAPKKQAILKGIAASKGEIIVTTDADSTMPPEWIATLVSHYTEEVGLVFGYAPYRTDGVYDSLFHKVLALEYLGSGTVAAATAGRGMAVTGFGANFSYRRRLFMEIGGFGSGINHPSGDDDLLLNRVRTSTEYRIRFAAEREAAVWNRPPKEIKALIRQRIRFSSKHLAYPKKVVAALGLIYAVYAILFLTLIGVWFTPVLRLPLGIALGLKLSGELPFLLRGQKLLEDRNLLKYYPLAVLPHILYVVFFPILGQIMPKKW